MRSTRPLSLLIVILVLLGTNLGATAPTGAQAASAPWVPPGLVEIERGSRTMEEIAAGFPAPNEAATLLAAWGWYGNAFYNYAGSTTAGTTSLEVSFHLFATPTGATEAMSYYAAGRALMLGFSPLPIDRYGDETLAIGGARDVGNEVTIYLRRGAGLARISAVAPQGDPFIDALFTSAALDVGAAVGASAVPRTAADLLPSLLDVPAGFVVSDEGTRNQDEIANTFLRPAEAASVLTASGFQTNVFRYFARPDGRSAYPGGATSIEISLYVFGSATGAASALPYYADGRAEAIGLRLVQIWSDAVMLQGVAPSGAGVEVTVYLLVGNVLARISAASPDGAPVADALSTTFVIAARA